MTVEQDRRRRRRALAHGAGALARVVVVAALVAACGWLAWETAHVPSEVSYARSQAESADSKASDVAQEVADAEATAKASSRSKSCAAAGKAVASAETSLTSGHATDQDVATLSGYGLDAQTPWATPAKPEGDVTVSFLTTTGFDGDSIPVAWSCADSDDGHAFAYVTATWDAKSQKFSNIEVWRAS